MSDEAKPDPLIFKGVCSEGILKGKEIEGKLDLKVIVASAKTKETPVKKSEWEPVFFWALFALMANMAIGDPAGMRKYSSPQRSPSHEQMLNQSGEQSLLPKNTSGSLSDR